MELKPIDKQENTNLAGLEEAGEEEEGDAPSKPMSANERAEKNIAAMQAENDRMEKNIAAQQELRATDMLSGTADAGQVGVKKEQTPEEYTRSVMAGEVGAKDEKAE